MIAPGWRCGTILKKAMRIRSSQIIRVFFSMMILLICNICEIKINFIWLWISPNPSKSKTVFKWLKNKTEIHSSPPLKEFSDMLEQITEARTISSLCARRQEAPKTKLLGWKRPDGHWPAPPGPVSSRMCPSASPHRPQGQTSFLG